jgi:hypothetical protein
MRVWGKNAMHKQKLDATMGEFYYVHGESPSVYLFLLKEITTSKLAGPELVAKVRNFLTFET